MGIFTCSAFASNGTCSGTQTNNFINVNPNNLNMPADLAAEPVSVSTMLGLPSGSTVLVSNSANNGEYRVNISTGAETLLFNVGLRPDGLIYDGAGDLFAVLNESEIAQINPITGAVIKTLALPTPAGATTPQADGLTYDASTGFIYVASEDGGVYHVNTALTSQTYQHEIMEETIPKFSYGTTELSNLEIAISPQRLLPYIQRAGGSRHRAILLYERNTALSECLYGVTQAVEIALRNSIHRALSSGLGPMWFDSVAAFDENSPQAQQIAEAKHDLQRNKRTVTPGGIVAALNLGFWTSLLSTRYEKQLWVPHLHKAFPLAIKQIPGKSSASAFSRAEIFQQLERIRNLRNRIAHHEPILKLDLPTLHSEALGAIKWLCQTTAQWVHHTTSFHVRFHEKPLSYPPPKLQEEPSRPTPGKPAPR